MLFERQARIGRFVLARHGQQDASLAKSAQVLLERLERLTARASLTELDSRETGVADHSAPQCVVEIQHHDLSTAAEGTSDDARDRLHVLDHQIERHRLFGFEPQARVVPAADAVSCRQPRGVDQVNASRHRDRQASRSGAG